jgi:diphthamide synthase (EF-2-diphthine--ammonia ligase)
MSCAALTSGAKDSILSCRKAIDRGKRIKYMVTARPRIRHSCIFPSTNLDGGRIVFTAAEGLDASFPGGRSDENCIERLKKVAACHQINLASEGGEYESTTLHAPVYTHLITFETSEIRSLKDRHELVPGEFA